MSNVTKILKRRLASAAKTNSRRVHVTPRNIGWAIRKEGKLQASRVLETRKEAIELGEKWVRDGKSSSIIIHDRNGRSSETIVRDENGKFKRK